MFKSLSAAAIAISLIAGPVFAQGNSPVTEPAKVHHTVKPQIVKPKVHKTSVHYKAHRHVAHAKKFNRHVAKYANKHVKKINTHVVKNAAKHVKPMKQAKTVKRIKQDKINTAG